MKNIPLAFCNKKAYNTPILEEISRSRKYMNRMISLSILIVALSVGYYFVLYLPQRDQAVQTVQAKEAAVTQEAKAQADSQAMQEKIQRKVDLNTCLLSAETGYKDEWASDCKTNAQRVQNGYQSCINEGLGQSWCQSTWGNPDASATCSLPASLATSVNNDLENAKADCFKQYPQ